MRFRALAAFGVAVPLLLAAQTQQTQPPPKTPPPASSSVGPATGTHYTNSSGQRVHVPMQAPSAPVGSTAKCRDGSYSFSQHARGTCSHHGGVSIWLRH
jgi:hypothetical protein